MLYNIILTISLIQIFVSVVMPEANAEEPEITIQSLRREIREAEHAIGAFSSEPEINRLIEIDKALQAIEMGSSPAPKLMITFKNIRLQIWLKALDLLDRCKDQNFNEKDVPAVNIAPPSSPGTVYDSGIAPESIKNPEARANYEELIKKNSIKMKNYSLQKKIRTFEKTWQEGIIAFISSNYRDKSELADVENMISLYIEDPTRRATLKQRTISIDK